MNIYKITAPIASTAKRETIRCIQMEVRELIPTHSVSVVLKIRTRLIAEMTIKITRVGHGFFRRCFQSLMQTAMSIASEIDAMVSVTTFIT
jgi:hypothetical protein